MAVAVAVAVVLVQIAVAFLLSLLFFFVARVQHAGFRAPQDVLKNFQPHQSAEGSVP